MSESSQPITPEIFRKAIEDLDLEQLHNEASRLHNSIFHLKRSNVSLAEFADDETCQQALAENKEVIEHQEARIAIITEEVEKRGFKMGHGSERDKAKNDENGTSAGTSADAATGATAPQGTETTPAATSAATTGEPQTNGGDGEEGVYL